MSGYGSWPAAARTMAQQVEAGVRAARQQDLVSFQESVQRLAHLDREQLASLLGELTRMLLERAHPDGVASEDAEELLRGCVRSAVGWYPDLDTDALIRALTGALGLGDADAAVGDTAVGDTGAGDADAPETVGAPNQGAPRRRGPDPVAVLGHGLLLVTELLATVGGELAPLLEAALGELMRAQTMELP